MYGASRVLAFLTDALSFGVSAASVSAIETPFQGERSTAARSLRAEIGEGLGWLWRRPFIRFMMVFMACLLLLANGLPLIVIVIAKHAGASSATVGLILGVTGVGGLVGSLVAPRLQQRWGFVRAFLATFWLFTLAWPLLALAHSLITLAAIGALALGVTIGSSGVRAARSTRPQAPPSRENGGRAGGTAPRRLLAPPITGPARRGGDEPTWRGRLVAPLHKRLKRLCRRFARRER